jgi:hypothetical protein
MRIHVVALALIFTAAGCGDNGGNENVKNDLSTGAPDLSVGGGDDFAMPGGDFAVSPDLTPETPSQQLQSVRNAGDSNPMTDGGVLTMALPVADVFVTYLRPEVAGETDDPAAFFVQAAPKGPALLIRVNPSSLSPVPLVGDKVKFTVTSAGKDSGGMHQALSITDWAVESSGNDLTSFVQDLSSATDLVSGVNNYESELIKVTGSVAGAFSSSGAGYVAADFDTAVLVSPSPLPSMRVPAGLRDTLDLTSGCALTVGPTPLMRFGTKLSQPSAWVNGDVNVTSCPAPKVLSARATDLTHVVVTFDRIIATAPSSGFTITPSLAVSAASAAGSTVTLTTVSQSAGQLYTVTADSTVEDTRNQGVDPAHDSAQFHGFASPATVMITEFSPGISKNSDLLELYVLSTGSVSGFTLQQDLTTKTKVLATLPDQYVHATDVIVLHIAPPTTAAPAPINEIAGDNDCTSNACYTNTWDALGTTDIGNSARVITIKDPSGAIQDGLAFYDGTAADADGAFFIEVQALVTAGQWSCATATCAVADVLSSKNTGNTPAGKSLQRKNGHPDTNAVGDWNAPATSTYGTVP